MNPLHSVFFGSTSDSVLVLERLSPLPVAIVTQMAKPVGHKKILTETPVAAWAKAHGVTILSFPTNADKPWMYADEGTVIDALEPVKADLLISACYGQKIPAKTIAEAAHGGLNVHPSILPRWRGADPVPWAILSGDQQTGVSIVTLSEKFDEGLVIAQKKIPVLPTDGAEPLRAKLFSIGADLLAEVLPDYLAGRIKGESQKPGDHSYARRLARQDGFEPWEVLQKAFTDAAEATRIERKFRAFMPWPGLWTMFENKRLKILGVTMNDGRLTIHSVQLEGKNPVAFSQFARAYHIPLAS